MCDHEKRNAQRFNKSFTKRYNELKENIRKITDLWNYQNYREVLAQKMLNTTDIFFFFSFFLNLKKKLCWNIDIHKHK